MFWNVVLGGNPDETISARTGRDAARDYKWAVALQWILSELSANHTESAIKSEQQRAGFVDTTETNFRDKGK